LATLKKGPLEPDDLKELVVKTLDLNKATDIEVIDLAHNAHLADHMIVCTGTSSRQVVSLAQKLIEKLHFYDITEIRKEGLNTGDWVVLDTGDIIVHIFRPEVRGFYNIEMMWGDFSATGAAPQHA
tara:strand:- start:294811 stop:295188 length:378 start_codon:yes stop_codon:yes gene_type:complete